MPPREEKINKKENAGWNLGSYLFQQ